VVIWDEVQTCIWPSRCHCQSLSLAPVNPDWFYLPGLPFWYLLTRVVPDIFQMSSKTIVCVCNAIIVAVVTIILVFPVVCVFVVTSFTAHAEASHSLLTVDDVQESADSTRSG